jgi:hypothetical protein
MMIYHSKIFIDERTPYNLTISPLYKYCQAISLWSRRFAQKNNFIISVKSTCDYIFCHCSFIKDHVLSGKRIITYCTNGDHYLRQDTDQSNVTLIDFTGRCEYTRLKYIKLDASFPLSDLQSLISNDMMGGRLPVFNLTVFVRDKKDIINILEYWINKKIKGNLYIFKSIITEIGLDMIDKIEHINSKIKGRSISLFNYDNDISRVVKALMSSPVSVFFERELVLVFWAIYLKSYPIIFKDEIINSRFTYLDSEEKTYDLLTSFLEYPRELQKLISQMSEFAFSKVDIFYEILAQGVVV